MNESQLKRSLYSIGMGCFIDYFDLFYSRQHSKEDLVEYLFEQNDFTEKSCKSRVSHALRIFRENKQIEALKLIEMAKRVHPHTKLQAAKLHAKLTMSPINFHNDPLISNLMGFKAKDTKCRRVYCTTCGGLSASIDRNINQKLIDEIQEFLSKNTIEKLYLYGDWYDYLIKFKK